MVIDSPGDTRAASMGGMLVTRMMKRGVRAVVIDGALRDGGELATLDFPSWSAAITATTRLSYHHVADLQVPITCAGVAVYPGDVMHSDGDNVIVVRATWAAEMADLCESRDALEGYVALRIQRGESLWGLYPASEETRAQYREWLTRGSPALDRI